MTSYFFSYKSTQTLKNDEFSIKKSRDALHVDKLDFISSLTHVIKI